MPFHSGRGLRQCGFLPERAAGDVFAYRRRGLTLGGEAAEHRLDVAGIKLVKLLNVLDDVRHLRRVEGDLLVGNVEMREFCYLSYVHIVSQKSEFRIRKTAVPIESRSTP